MILVYSDPFKNKEWDCEEIFIEKFNKNFPKGKKVKEKFCF